METDINPTGNKPDDWNRMGRTCQKPIGAEPRAMTVAEVVLESLVDHGVECVFGYPGGAVLPLYDALYSY